MHQGFSSLKSSKISLQQLGGVRYAHGSNLVQASRDGEVNILLALANSLQIFDAGLGFLIGSFYEVREIDSGNPNSRYGSARICQTVLHRIGQPSIPGPFIILVYGMKDLHSPIDLEQFRSSLNFAKMILNSECISPQNCQWPLQAGTYPMGSISKRRIDHNTSIRIISEVFEDSMIPVKIFGSSHNSAEVGSLGKHDGARRLAYRDWWIKGLYDFYSQQQQGGAPSSEKQRNGLHSYFYRCILQIYLCTYPYLNTHHTQRMSYLHTCRNAH
jgi:hypothetical protein